jgi:hypothetical protein
LLSKYSSSHHSDENETQKLQAKINSVPALQGLVTQKTLDQKSSNMYFVLSKRFKDVYGTCRMLARPSTGLQSGLMPSGAYDGKAHTRTFTKDIVMPTLSSSSNIGHESPFFMNIFTRAQLYHFLNSFEQEERALHFCETTRDIIPS